MPPQNMIHLLLLPIVVSFLWATGHSIALAAPQAQTPPDTQTALAQPPRSLAAELEGKLCPGCIQGTFPGTENRAFADSYG